MFGKPGRWRLPPTCSENTANGIETLVRLGMIVAAAE
jgi:hypothetical protein